MATDVLSDFSNDFLCKLPSTPAVRESEDDSDERIIVNGSSCVEEAEQPKEDVESADAAEENLTVSFPLKLQLHSFDSGLPGSAVEDNADDDELELLPGGDGADEEEAEDPLAEDEAAEEANQALLIIKANSGRIDGYDDNADDDFENSKNEASTAISDRLNEADACTSPTTTATLTLVPSVSTDASRHPPPQSLDDLEQVCTIGTGTFGRVLLCRQKDADEQYFAMKIMPIETVLKTKQTEHVRSERKILLMIEPHPFIVQLFWTHHDDTCLYMCFEFICGGELFSYLRAYGHFANETARFYAAEILLALEYLHSLNIVYRDLKPENLILTREGHLKITDFGFAKQLTDRTWTLCGTPEYLAPEIIENRGHNKAVDFWALGVLIFEMISGYTPFNGNNPLQIYEAILEGKPKFPKHFNLAAKDLVKKLLAADRTKRIGSMKNGASDVKSHKWFHEVDWSELIAKNVQPPIIPTIESNGDANNFDEYEELDFATLPPAKESEIRLFSEW